MIGKKLIKLLIIFSWLFAVPHVFSQESANKNTVIINNEASAGQVQTITAPALIPSKAVKLRDARKKQEIKTEDTIIQELEKQRLLDEQKRIDELMGNTSSGASAPLVQSPVAGEWFFGKKAFVSVGLGFVTYPSVTNVNSTELPAGFLSFGGYGYEGHLIFDLSLYYSRQYIKMNRSGYQNVRAKVDQPSLSMSIKYSPLSGQIKPYAGVAGSLVYRSKWDFVNKLGDPITDPETKKRLKDVGNKEWHQSFDAGVAVGADLALGKNLGVNVDLRYYWNIDTENRKTVQEILTGKELLDKVESLVISGNLRYYF